MAADNEASRPLVASREDSGVSDMLRQISRDSGSMGVGSVTDAEPEFRAQRFDSHGALRLDVDGHGLDDTEGTDIPAEVDVGMDVDPLTHKPKWFSWRLLWKYTGPGWLMSIAYLDPGNLESDLQAGAYTGYRLLWVLFWSTVLGLLLQVLAARLGVVTGKHLAQVCRARYPKPAYLALWIMTEIAIVGSDIQEVIGSAIALRILFNFPLWLGCLVTGLDTFTFLAIHYFGIRKLEAVFVALISIMLVCFSINFVIGKPDFGALAEGVILPEVKSYGVLQAVGILGAVIMPHNIYLHSALVQSRKVDRHHPMRVAEAVKYNTIESAIALGVSFIINAAVVAVFAKGFFLERCARESNGNAGFIDGKCQQIGLLTAGDSLQGFLGKSAKYVWAIGLLAAGQSSTMTGTFAGQYVMEGFLNITVAAWKRVALTRTVALAPAVAVALIAQSHTTAADSLDEWLNVLQSVQLPFALLPVLKFTSMREIMGGFKSGKIMRLIVWVTAMFVMATNVYLIQQSADDLLPHTWYIYLLIAVLGVLYFGFIFYLIHEELFAAIASIRQCCGCAKREKGRSVYQKSSEQLVTPA